VLLSRRNTFAFIASLVAAAVFAGVMALPSLERHYFRQQAEQDTVPLKLAAESLRAAIDRYAPLPALIAERGILAELLTEPDNAQLLAQVNEDLRQTATAVRASDVFLMDITGKTLAAASYRQPMSFVGRNFSYRAYFSQALEGALSSFQVHGTTTGEHGYFYAAPVEDGTRIVGVLAVKFNIDAFESVWRGADSDFIVTDRNDFILMSSRPDWHFRAMRPLSERTHQVIAQYLQYPIDRIERLPITTYDLSDTAQYVDVETGQTEGLVMTRLHLPDYDWTIASLSPTTLATLNAVRTLLLVELSVLLLLAGLLAFMLKRGRQREAFVREQRAKRALEDAVTSRTADLRRALADLERTQMDLVQAGKLAGLGKMSAALSHELNQPLAAVKAYADNARAFLKRKDTAQADENLESISKMADRMATISTHLRNFARRPQQATRPLLLNTVVQDAIAVLDVRLATGGGRIEYTPPKADVWVIGGHVRLQQVILNLLNNALDAMAEQSAPVVRVTVSGTSVLVRDTGPGIGEEISQQMFDPFFTTKSPGNGLGLGLSISYNIVNDFGGTLAARNHPEGGAEFSVTLQAATPEEIAAQ
jgi:two-component system, NtrC family, C4-dicarboxylate transport sensor histidine kinase DctB